jgi:hypothetical protein
MFLNVPEEPLEPDVHLNFLMNHLNLMFLMNFTEEPLEPDATLVPLVPLMNHLNRLVPDEPLEPDVPLEPEEPDVPEEPDLNHLNLMFLKNLKNHLNLMFLN